ncbi:MAG: TonB-dependent receptor [Porphyrobacter sp.]|nr:TonB-dependent receptor [Porphyrobacter sp.]
MTTGKKLAGLLLLTTALTCPMSAWAQDADQPAASEETAAPEEASEPASADQSATEDDISIPGGAIIVTGRINRDPTRGSSQVLSVLSTEQIARTGEGNIAGALGRVTGLSVVGSGFVYVRGLGDRYSLALLNGSPLPSPEPLRRVVPLDLFPTGVIASSLVQKSYSANYPGEFGGGVINLTTKAIPNEAFLTVGIGGQWDTETTNQLGYDYFGSSSDWTGFDNGQRNTPPALQAFFDSGARISDGTVDTQAIASQLVNGRNAIVQRWDHLPINYSISLSGGDSWDVGDGVLGLIVGGGFSSKWLNRDAIQQSSLSSDLSTLDTDFRRVTTDQRMVTNALVGLGYEFGDHTIRWTNLFIRDTIKQARLGQGEKDEGLADFLQQDTAWYERQLIDTQFVGEFKLADRLGLDVRAGYANSQREAPFELSFEYVRSNSATDPLGDQFVNRLNRNSGSADVAFSDLNEDLWSGGLDLSYEVVPEVVVTVGGAYQDTERTQSRRGFLFDAPSTFEPAVGLFRPDLLLQPSVIDYYNIGLIEEDESTPSFLAELETYAAYGKATIEFAEGVSLDAGVRYESADQTVTPIQVFTNPTGSMASTALSNSYWLPGATLTWEVQPDLQLRASASKTIARPQFRELIYQPYTDPESNRAYIGNPLLVDSELWNGELRGEWYFDADQRVSVAGFYKKIDRPIEAFVTQLSGLLTTSYANAPEAQLYGGELELQKYFDFAPGTLPGDRRVVVIGNYTYTKSKLKVGPDDTTAVFAASSNLATDYFRDGSPLTGQSDHIVNVQIGLEHPDRLSQQTFLLTYASERVVSRGLNGSPPQPDVVEKPGVRLDFVAREGVQLAGKEVELKFELRNILGTGHEEFQQSGENRIDVNTYDMGRIISVSAQVTF